MWAVCVCVKMMQEVLMRRLLVSFVFAGALAIGAFTFSGAPASALPVVDSSLAATESANTGVEQTHWRRYYHYHRRYYRHHYYHPYRHYYRRHYYHRRYW
jgi:hypothetical protein